MAVSPCDVVQSGHPQDAARSALVGDGGVRAIGQGVAKLGWLFRPRPVHNVGIDAIVDVVKNEQGRGPEQVGVVVGRAPYDDGWT